MRRPVGPRKAWLYGAALLMMGAGWGLSQPLTKIAVSTGHAHFGLIFWQLVLGALVTSALVLARGRGLPMHPAALRVYVIVAAIGTLIPNSISYQAIAHIPAGVQSILMSVIPMMALPGAIALGMERFDPKRMAGLLLGLGGVLLLVLPEASLPDRSMLPWVALALIAPFCYAMEANYVGRWGTAGLDPFQVLCGASILGLMVALPLAVGTGQFISPVRVWSAPEWAFVAASLIHVLVYATYVWLVDRAGAVFAAQVSYLVTGFGVLWSMLILSETYSPFIWAALALVLLGVALVQPRQRDALAADASIGDAVRRSDGTGRAKT